jgi:hypothetical protein
MPFAGDAEQARSAVDALLALDTAAGDVLILADNEGPVTARDPVQVVKVSGERSPAHARNVGAAHARTDWILFLDADCRPRPDLLDVYFATPVDDGVGAVTGEVRSGPAGQALVARYGAARGFLNQQAHLEHPFRPRVAAANLVVRRSAFEAVGGFFEGVRAAEDTDFSWRLQQAGWRLELRAEAWVEHRYRTSLRELRRQWRGYAAGRAWLARRYEGFTPQPGLLRAFQRGRARVGGAPASVRGAPARPSSRLERGSFLALDALLSVDELAGLTLSNRPTPAGTTSPAPPQAVLVADRFPARDDPLVELAEALDRVRVEAVARPTVPDLSALQGVHVDYLEDDGLAARALDALSLIVRHPVRCAWDLVRRGRGELPLRALAPAARRLEHDATARVHSLGGEEARGVARRLAALTGRTVQG